MPRVGSHECVAIFHILRRAGAVHRLSARKRTHGAPIYDVVFGSLATLIAAFITYKMRNRVSKYLAPLPSVVVNALVVGWLLTYVYQVGVTYWVAAGYVAVGQAIACFALGIPLMKLLERFRGKLFGEMR